MKEANEELNKMRQDLLDKLLEKELKRLKKICFNFKHRTLLEHEVVIVSDNLSKVHASGSYEKIQNGKNAYRYSHKISIDNSIIDEYYIGKFNKYYTKNYCKKVIQEVIRHEIVHAFTLELFEDISDIDHVSADSSPIFLSLLYWLNGRSNHRGIWFFLETETYRDISCIDTFREVYNYLVKLIKKYNKVCGELSKVREKGSYMNNKFSFASRNSGLYAESRTALNFKDLKGKDICNISYNVFLIGFTIRPNNISNLVYKKINNNCFNKYENRNIYLSDEYSYEIENGNLNKQEIPNIA